MLERKLTKKEENDITNEFVESIGFTKYHYLVFVLCGLILIVNGIQIILQAFLLSLLSTVESINLEDISLVLSFENLGNFIAYLMIMIFSKYLQNKQTIQILSVLLLILNGLAIISFKFSYIVVIRTFMGICMGSLDILIFVMLLEMCSIRIRGFMSTIILMFNPIGQVIASLIAFWSIDEKAVENNFGLLIKLPFIIMIVVVILVIFIQETPRHFFEDKKYSKGIDTYINNSKVSDLLRKKTNVGQKFETDHSDIEIIKIEHFNITDLFADLKYYTITIVLLGIFYGFIHFGIYFILPTNAPKLSKPEVLKLILSVAIDIPSIITCYFIIDSNFFGRRGSINISIILSILFSSLCFIFPDELLIMVFIKFSASITIASLTIYSCELYSKNLRTSIIALFNLGKRTSMLLTPTIVTFITKHFDEHYNYLLFTILGLISVFSFFVFKIETKNSQLNSIEVKHKIEEADRILTKEENELENIM